MDLLFCCVEGQVADIESGRILQRIYLLLRWVVISVIIGVPSVVPLAMLLLQSKVSA